MDGSVWDQGIDKADGNDIFAGNTDPTSHVTVYLQDPVVVRYLRMEPTTWFSWIVLRFDELGCDHA
jgi:hypothetical protein